MSSKNIDTLKKDYDWIREQLKRLKKSSKSETQKKNEAEILKKKADETKTKIQSEILSSKTNQWKTLSDIQKIEEIEKMINSVSKKIDALYNEITNQHLAWDSADNKSIFKSIGGWIENKILNPIGRFFKNLFWWWNSWDNPDNENQGNEWDNSPDQTTENGWTDENAPSETWTDSTDDTNGVENETTSTEKLKCKWWEYLWIDVSRFNTMMNLEAFKKWNRENWDSKDNALRWVSFIYIRAWDGAPKDSEWDKKMLENWINFVNEYNNDIQVKNNHEEIAAWLYWRLSLKKDRTWEDEAKEFLEMYNKYKNKQWVCQLVPMLDLENNMFNNDPSKIKEKALKRLEYVEKQTWIVPGLYVWAAAYGDYIKNDSRFDKYQTVWIAAYSNYRVNQEEWTILVWWSKKTTVRPAMYQFSETWSVPWTWTSKWETDKNHTKDIAMLYTKNNTSLA